MNHQKATVTVRQIVWTFAVLVMTGACSFDFHESEFQCEQAMARVEECCPGFDPAHYSCIYADSRGCATGSEPDLTLDESQRITEATCAEILEMPICKRVTTPATMAVNEQAIAILDECCSSYFCTTGGMGWFTSTSCNYPTLSHDEALCIAASSCTDDMCERATNLVARESSCR